MFGITRAAVCMRIVQPSPSATGTISGCSASNGGGLYAKIRFNHQISGGTISGCTTSDTGMGGGLFADKSTITISGGTIKNNKSNIWRRRGAEQTQRLKMKKPIKQTGRSLAIKRIKPPENRRRQIFGGGIYLTNGSMNVSDSFRSTYLQYASLHLASSEQKI